MEPLLAAITGTCTLDDGVTGYVVSVTSSDALKQSGNQFKWSVRRRYREFRELKEHLDAAGGGASLSAGARDFPGKFNSPFASQESIAGERSAALGAWLQAVIGSSNAHYTEKPGAAPWSTDALGRFERFLGVQGPSGIDDSVEVVAPHENAALLTGGGGRIASSRPDPTYSPLRRPRARHPTVLELAAVADHIGREATLWGCVYCVGVLGLMGLLAVCGMVVFGAAEMGAENDRRAAFAQYMQQHKAKYNISDVDFAVLVDKAGMPVDFDPESVGGDERSWGTINYNTLLFTFSVMTTIG
eukprot:COSAG05_NODE_210_length_14015_cov_3.851785_8_plen_301_part_00